LAQHQADDEITFRHGYFLLSALPLLPQLLKGGNVDILTRFAVSLFSLLLALEIMRSMMKIKQSPTKLFFKFFWKFVRWFFKVLRKILKGIYNFFHDLLTTNT